MSVFSSKKTQQGVCDTAESAWNGLKKGWKTPMVEKTYNPDRTRLSLEFVKKQAIKTSDKNKRQKQAIKASDKNQCKK